MDKKGVKAALLAIKKDKFEKWEPSYKKKKKSKKEPEPEDPLAVKPEKTPEEIEEEERKQKEKEEKEAKKKAKAAKKKKKPKKKYPAGHKPTRFIPDKELIRKMIKTIMKFGQEDEESLWKKIAF